MTTRIISQLEEFIQMEHPWRRWTDRLTFYCCPFTVVFLVMVSLSVPVWYDMYFLAILFPDGTEIRLGAFGYTGSSVTVGYDFGGVTKPLTRALIFHPIAAFLSGEAILFAVWHSLCVQHQLRSFTAGGWYQNRKFASRMMAIFCTLSFIAALIAFITDNILIFKAQSYYLRKGCSVRFGSAAPATFLALLFIWIRVVLLSMEVVYEYFLKPEDPYIL